MPSSDAFHGIDGVLVVNMDRRPDRWQAFQDAWRDVLPWDRVIRFSATEGVALPGYGQRPWFRGGKRDRTWAGRAGCAVSHARALREARARGWNRTLVLEDDAIPTDSLLVADLGPDIPWDLLYLGGREPEGPFVEVSPSVVRIHGALDTHAYVVNAGLRDWMIARLPDETSAWPWVARERAIDRWMRREIGRRFIVTMRRPQAAVQADDISDITMRRESAYDDPDLLRVRRPFRDFSEARRMTEIAADRTRGAVKRAVGF